MNVQKLTNPELISFFNKLTGQKVTRFSSRERGEIIVNGIISKTKKMRVKVQGRLFKSVKAAFDHFKFPLEKEEKFRLKLYLTKSCRASFAGMRFTRAAK